MKLSPAAIELLDSKALAHLVTLNPDGSPQVAIVWVGVEDGEIVSAHLDPNQKKVRNIQRDPRVVLSLETDRLNQYGLMEYLVVHGTARITEGGAPDLLQRLAHTYLGPDVVFPAMDDPPPGVVTRIRIDRVGGMGAWVGDGGGEG